MDFQTLLDNAVQWLRDGFTNINHPQGLLIALIATVFMQSWKQWLPITLVALVVDRVVQVLGPVLANRSGGAQVALPHNLMEQDYWTQAGVLYVGYLVVIGIFFFLKRMLFRGRAAAH